MRCVTSRPNRPPAARTRDVRRWLLRWNATVNVTSWLRLWWRVKTFRPQSLRRQHPCVELAMQLENDVSAQGLLKGRVNGVCLLTKVNGLRAVWRVYQPVLRVFVVQAPRTSRSLPRRPRWNGGSVHCGLYCAHALCQGTRGPHTELRWQGCRCCCRCCCHGESSSRATRAGRQQGITAVVRRFAPVSC